MAELNKDHWYDGWFYDKFIAPNQDRLFGKIKNLVNAESNILDLGCGTGRFSFFIKDYCNSILGIDLSKRNISRANLTLSENPSSKISFQHKSIRKIISEGKEHFDIAVMTYVIHEVNEEDRENLLNEIAQVADKIIIGDYLFPRPGGFWSGLNEVVEFAAGREHYRNFKSYLAGGGIPGIANRGGFKVIKEIKNEPFTSHIVVLEK
ncbi:MAG: class I SAM-dependent methyltransferase [Ignavibacteriaceae bacterium]